jgi:outer membrane receptor protein involved in Fe transport
MNLRISYNSTLVRPSFKEKSIAQIQDFITGRTFIGNIDLVRSNIQNYDLRWEKFFDNGELISLSGFHKRFNNPIELVSYNELSPDNFTPRNFDGVGTVSGVEIELKKSLSVISNTLSNFSFGVNASVITSEIKRDTKVDLYDSDTRPMAGQSPYLINASIAYRNQSGLEINTGYNVQGKRLSIVGIGVNPDVYENPFHALDAKVSKSFAENKYKISVSANNLLQSKRQFTYDGGSINTGEYLWAYYNPGTTYNLSFSASLK